MSISLHTEKKSPEVSIILPTFNGEKTIKTAIQSVLRQSFFNWELIIIDDGSTDTTQRCVADYVARDPRISLVVHDTNKGIQASLNQGLSLAQGTFIARIDDDDEWVDERKLQKQVDFLNTHTDVVLLGTSVRVADGQGRVITWYMPALNDETIRNRILGKNCFAHASVMFSREVALQVGGYSELTTVRHCEDYDLWLKMGTQGKFANMPDYTLQYNLRSEGISQKNKRKQLYTNISLIKKYKDKYPYFWFWYIISWVRLLVFILVGWLLFSPAIFFWYRWYKEI